MSVARSGLHGRRRRRQGSNLRRRTGLQPGRPEVASVLHLEACLQLHIAELHPRRRSAIALVSRRKSTPLTPKLIPRQRFVADATSQRGHPILGKHINLGARANLIDIRSRNRRAAEHGQQKHHEHRLFLSQAHPKNGLRNLSGDPESRDRPDQSKNAHCPASSQMRNKLSPPNVCKSPRGGIVLRQIAIPLAHRCCDRDFARGSAV